MFIITVIRFLMGYVSFSAYGGFPERFINLCTKNRIPLWNVKNEQKCLKANTTVNGYKNIRHSARRSGVKVRIEKKHGLPFFLNRNKMRKGIVIGIALSVLAVCLLSTRVWVITVDGNNHVSDERILEVFSQLGVKIGSAKSSLVTSEITDEAALIIDELAWVSLNIKGSCAEIIVSERKPAPQFPETDIPCNIVSEDDGVITEIEVYSGEAAVRVGDAVVKGDLLISGITENLDKSESLKTARGNVYARTQKDIIITPSQENFLRQSEEKTRTSLFFLGLEIPLSLPVDETNFYRTESYLSDGEINLPVGIIKEHSYSAESAEPLPDEVNSLYCAKCFMEQFRALFEISQLENRDFTLTNDNGYITYNGHYTVVKETGRVSEIFVEKN